MALVAVLFPILFGMILGNTSEIARNFLGPGEKLIIPFAAFALGTGIDFQVIFTSGVPGLVLGLLTIILSGGLAMLAIYLWHVLRRHPKNTRNVISGACEATTAGNAIATPVAVAAADPSYAPILDVATTQVAASVVVTALIVPFLVSAVAKWQHNRGISPENEEAFYEDRIHRKKELAGTGTGDT